MTHNNRAWANVDGKQIKSARWQPTNTVLQIGEDNYARYVRDGNHPRPRMVKQANPTR